jgi:multidrug efflux pump subunit AcrA (membrane-fusion protein)
MTGTGTPLLPGERVEVALPLRESGGAQLVVPWSAIVRDAQGGAWVYERKTANAFSRRPVMVRSLVGDWAILERGPTPGTLVVTVGVAELFGTEFGTGK